MKKRCLAMVLALLMVCALAAPALAAETRLVEAIPCRYDDAKNFSEGLMAVKLNGKWGFIGKTGKEVIPCKYDGAGYFSEGLAAVLLNGKWGFIDKTGKEVIPCQYDSVGNFSEGLARVCLDDKWGFIDKLGNQVISCKYDHAMDFSEGIAKVGVYSGQEWSTILKEFIPTLKYGFVDNTGREITSPSKYVSVGKFSEGLADVKLDDKWGYVDVTGKEVIPSKYSSALSFTQEGAWVRDSDGKWGLIDKTGKEIIPCQYVNSVNDYPTRSPEFHEGIAVVKKKDDWSSGSHYGAVDATGKVVIPFEFARIYDFCEGHALAMYEDSVWSEYALFDKNGVKTDFNLPPSTFLTYEWQRDGMFPAFKREAKGPDDYRHICGYLDATGREAIPFRYDGTEPFYEGMGCVCKGYIDPDTKERYSKCGFVDKTGREVVPCKYDYAEDFRDGFAYVKINIGEPDAWGRLAQKCGLIDKTGREVLPCQYDEIHISSEDNMVQVALNGKYGYYAIIKEETAYSSTQTVDVDGEKVTFQCYALKDANGNDTNYIKLRDVASVFNGSTVQFNVGWDGAVNIETGKGYAPNGSEMKTPFSGNRVCENATAATNIDGKAADLDAIVLKDDAGGAYTYYKLRDLGAALGFKVNWTAEKGIFIETK